MSLGGLSMRLTLGRGIALAALLAVWPTPRGWAKDDAKVLRVMMYPYVPEASDLFNRLETLFERTHPGVDLQLVDTYVDGQGKTQAIADGYYDDATKLAQADVYELDTVLLGDMQTLGRVSAVDIPPKRFLPMAETAVSLAGRSYAMPHWACGNFLFYRATDHEIGDAQTWSQLKEALKGGALVGDLKGSSTLGEWYLTALLGSYDKARALSILDTPMIDGAARSALGGLLDLCPVGYCRSRRYHNMTGYYPRMFARGQARAYVGYSESIFYALREIAENCGPTSACLRQDEIRVRALPPLGASDVRVGWVDAFALSTALPPDKRLLANDFIALATSVDGYRAVLGPTVEGSPRYLLSALRPDVLGEIPDAPLYNSFNTVFGDRVTLNGPGSNSLLRSRGASLDCALPIDRDDSKSLTACNPSK
jgi:thiamine pyridinylase